MHLCVPVAWVPGMVTSACHPEFKNDEGMRRLLTQGGCYAPGLSMNGNDGYQEYPKLKQMTISQTAASLRSCIHVRVWQ
jgi:hypothetical protein